MMKAGLVSIALALASSTAFAQGQGDDAALQPGRGFCLELAKQSDTNKDGMVSRAELMKLVSDVFSRKDAGKRDELTVDQAADVLLYLSGQKKAP